MDAHDHAVQWARLNRRIIAERAAAAARADLRPVNDLPHNMVERERSAGGDVMALHRKGAAASDRGLVPVPGSRGTLSYLVEPLPAMRTEALASLAHGAGRKYDRGSMHGRVRVKKSDVARLERNPYGGIVVCGDRGLLAEEAPEAYKNIERVIADLVEFGLARVVATFRPLVTFKKAQSNVAAGGSQAGEILEGGSPMIRLLFTSGRGPAECRIAVRQGCCNACGRSCFARSRNRLPGRAEHGRAWSGLGHRRHPWRRRGGIRAAVDRRDPVGGAKPAPAASQAEELVYRRVRASGAAGCTESARDPAMSALKPSAPAAPAASIRTRPRAPCAPPTSRAASPSWCGRSARSIATRRWHWSGSRRCSGCRVNWQAITAQNDAHAAHDRLERGRPVKRFKGTAFQAS